MTICTYEKKMTRKIHTCQVVFPCQIDSSFVHLRFDAENAWSTIQLLSNCYLKPVSYHLMTAGTFLDNREGPVSKQRKEFWHGAPPVVLESLGILSISQSTVDRPLNVWNCRKERIPFYSWKALSTPTSLRKTFWKAYCRLTSEE